MPPRAGCRAGHAQSCELPFAADAGDSEILRRHGGQTGSSDPGPGRRDDRPFGAGGRAGSGGREIVENREILLQEQDHPPARIVERNIVRQDRNGRTVSISEYWQNGTNWARTEARIDATSAQIVRQTNSGTHRRPSRFRQRPLRRGGGLLAGWDPARTPRLEFENFNLDAGMWSTS